MPSSVPGHSGLSSPKVSLELGCSSRLMKLGLFGDAILARDMRGEARGEVKGECCEDLMRKSVGRTARPGGGAGLAVALRGELATGVLLRDLSCHGAGELRRMTKNRHPPG